MFNNNIIEKRVMAVIKAKIATAQKDYDEGVDDLKEASFQAIETITTKLKTDKEKLADDLVNGILQKIL